MTNEQGFTMIGERADALAKDTSVQKKMLEIEAEEGKEEAINFYICFPSPHFVEYRRARAPRAVRFRPAPCPDSLPCLNVS